MPVAADVTPGKWSEIIILFDNGNYSMIAGIYEENQALGERWNGENGQLGFPNTAGYPVWHVIPDFLEISVLHGILDEILRNPYPDSQNHIENIMNEIRRRI